MSNTTVDVNDSLLKLDNVIEAANYLLEELKTRREELVSPETLTTLFVKVFENADYNIRRSVANWLMDCHRSDIFYYVSDEVMGRIDRDIERMVHSRVESYMRTRAQRDNPSNDY
jgi:hypothetical protein